MPTLKNASVVRKRAGVSAPVSTMVLPLIPCSDSAVTGIVSVPCVITYRDAYPELPDGDNVVSLVVNGMAVDFTDADTYYDVSTVNYLAAGSCNFNDDGETLWPLEQITADTQFYVRDSVIDYIMGNTPISPQVEGRLVFSTGQ